MAINNVFNGSRLVFGGDDIGGIEDIEWHVGGQTVDVGCADDSIMLWGCGLDDIDVTVTVKGTPMITREDVGSLAVTWNADYNDDPLGNAICTDSVTSGSKNGPITTKLQFKPCPDGAT